MTEVIVNSKPLKWNPEIEENIISQSSSSDYEILRISDCTIYGVIIWIRNEIGEVLTKMNFDNNRIHFLFNKNTIKKYKEESDPAGIGTHVNISYQRRLVQGSMSRNHYIIPIETMEIYNCCTLIMESIYITHNCSKIAGVTIGITEQNNEIAFHPSCNRKLRYETYRAAACGKYEFKLDDIFIPCERIKRMVKVYAIKTPFPIEIDGSLSKIRSFVVEKISDLNTFRGDAVILNIVRNMHMEAAYLENGERVIFNVISCQSNILNKLLVGSIVEISSTCAFPSSLYHWYGFDVRFSKLQYQNKKSLSRNLRTETSIFDKRLKICGQNKKILNSRTNSALADLHALNVSVEYDCDFQNQTPQKKKYEKKDILPIGNSAPFKPVYHLINGFDDLISTKNRKLLLSSYNICEQIEEKEEKVEWRIERKPYSIKLRDKVVEALRPFNLVRVSVQLQQRKLSKEPKGTSTLSIPEVEYTPPENIIILKNPKSRPQFDLNEVLEYLADENGISRYETKLKNRFVLPDTNWMPREIRTIGIYDDVQWVMMGTFCKSVEEVERIGDKEAKCKEPLQGGWWYRRSVPREMPTTIVERIVTKRNILRDCTVSSLNELF